MKTEDILSVLVPVTYFVFLGIEQFVEGREFPKIKFWESIGVLFVIMLLSINAVLPSLLPVEWIASHSLFDGTKLGILGGILGGFLVLTFVSFVFHYTQHQVDFLWRWTHQIHHSPERVDISATVFTHPFEAIINVLLSLFVTVFLLGLDGLAAAWIGYVGAFLAMFAHFNIHTPQWLGYIIQRPESHCYHHEPGAARYNFADIPLWDILFGTFKNPAKYDAPVGFEPKAARRVFSMLIGRDVNKEMNERV